MAMAIAAFPRDVWMLWGRALRTLCQKTLPALSARCGSQKSVRSRCCCVIASQKASSIAGHTSLARACPEKAAESHGRWAEDGGGPWAQATEEATTVRACFFVRAFRVCVYGEAQSKCGAAP